MEYILLFIFVGVCVLNIAITKKGYGQRVHINNIMNYTWLVCLIIAGFGIGGLYSPSIIVYVACIINIGVFNLGYYLYYTKANQNNNIDTSNTWLEKIIFTE